MATLRLKSPPSPDVLAHVARTAGSPRSANPGITPSGATASIAVDKPPLTKAQAKALADKLHASRMATKAIRLPIIAQQVAKNQKIIKRAAEAQLVAWRKEDIARCRELYPAVFDPERPLPLAIGIHKQLAPHIGTKRAHRLLAWWVHSPLYAAAIVAGGPRYALDGTQAGKVTEAQQQKAQEWLASLRTAA